MEVGEFIDCEDMFFLGQTAKTRKALGGGGRADPTHSGCSAHFRRKSVVFFFWYSFFVVSNVSVDLLDLHLPQLPKYPMQQITL